MHGATHLELPMNNYWYTLCNLYRRFDDLSKAESLLFKTDDTNYILTQKLIFHCRWDGIFQFFNAL